MGNNHGRPVIDKVCHQIDDFVNAPATQNLTFESLVKGIQNIVKNAEEKYGASKIHQSYWRVNFKEEQIHASWYDRNRSIILSVDWTRAIGNRGGCYPNFGSEDNENGNGIEFFSEHFREPYNESTNIDGILTFVPSSILSDCPKKCVRPPVICPTSPQPPKPPGGSIPPQPPKPPGGSIPPQPPKPPGGSIPPQPPKPPGGSIPPQPPKPPVDESTCQIIICGNCRHRKCSCYRYRSRSSGRSRKRH